MRLSQRLDRGPDLAGYAEWKSATSSEACLNSEARIQEVSSSMPLYPVQQTRYNKLAGAMMVVNLGVEELKDFEFWSSTMMGGGGGGDQVQSCWFQHGNVENWVYSRDCPKMSIK